MCSAKDSVVQEVNLRLVEIRKSKHEISWPDEPHNLFNIVNVKTWLFWVWSRLQTIVVIVMQQRYSTILPSQGAFEVDSEGCFGAGIQHACKRLLLCACRKLEAQGHISNCIKCRLSSVICNLSKGSKLCRLQLNPCSSCSPGYRRSGFSFNLSNLCAHIVRNAEMT